MDDRTLLEKAAKAAGMADAQWQDMSGWGEVRYGFSQAIWSEAYGDYWNPLDSDAQALRLAVKLRLAVNHYGEGTAVMLPHHSPEGFSTTPAIVEDSGADPDAATRRAIVRAAAAMAE